MIVSHEWCILAYCILPHVIRSTDLFKDSVVLIEIDDLSDHVISNSL